jgi:methylphosphotriester-DNA--protein-cysteine methyltransferase
LKDVKLSSSMISQRSVHSSKPIRVAMVLRDLESFKGNFDYHWLFQKTLGMTPDAMVTKWHSGELEQVHSMTKFTLDRCGPV